MITNRQGRAQNASDRWDAIIGEAAAAALADKPYPLAGRPDHGIPGMAFPNASLRETAEFFCLTVPGFSLQLLVAVRDAALQDRPVTDIYPAYIRWFCGVFIHDKIKIGEGIGQARNIARHAGRELGKPGATFDRVALQTKIVDVYNNTKDAQSKALLKAILMISAEGLPRDQVSYIGRYESHGLCGAIKRVGKEGVRQCAQRLIDIMRGQ